MAGGRQPALPPEGSLRLPQRRQVTAQSAVCEVRQFLRTPTAAGHRGMSSSDLRDRAAANVCVPLLLPGWPVGLLWAWQHQGGGSGCLTPPVSRVACAMPGELCRQHGMLRARQSAAGCTRSPC